MGSEFVPLLFILMAGISIYWTVSIIFTNNTDASALSWASGNAPEKSKSKLIETSRTLVHQFTLQYAVRIRNANLRQRINRQLLTSGLHRELNVDEFIGLQILWGIFFPILLCLLNFTLSLGFNYFILALGTALFGFFMPQFHLNAERKRRVTSVLIDLPFFIDLLALATEAGLDLQGAILRLVEKTSGSGSVLSEELENVLRDIRLGSSRAEAFRGFASRLDMNEINSLVNMIIDDETTGAGIAKVLKVQSEQLRLERFVRAEKAGAQASQLILMPMMFFILPAIFLVVLGPVVLSFMFGGGK